jgi:hypothetical protein
VSRAAATRRGRLGVGHVALAVPLVAAIVSSRLTVRDNSYLWHVRAGTLQIDRGSVLTSDPFSFTAQGRPWRTQSWLADLLYGWADRRWGLAVVTVLVLVGAILMTAAIALRVFRVLPAPLPAALGTLWVMWLVLGYFTPRPVLFSLVLLAVFLVAADDGKLRWTLPLLMWVWAAVHGGFIMGIGYLVLDGLRRKDRRRVVDVGVCLAATLVTAHGWGIWEVVVKFLGSGQALDLIAEWLTPDLISLELFPFALALVALLFGAVAGRIKRADLWVIVPFLLFAFSANRAVPIAALVMAPWFVSVLGRVPTSSKAVTAPQGLLNAVLVAALLIVPWLAPIDGGLDQELFAVQAVRHLEPGPTFHDDAVGGYLIYREWPERLVYIDDRAELYGDLFVEFVGARGGAPVWREVFARYEIDQALLKVEDPLGQVLAAAGWRETYRDDRFIVLQQD